jgi:isopropylmalate/homocitrate/citramalate synthase
VTTEPRPLVSEKWHLSEYNVHGRPKQPRFVLVTDCTLREGEQTPGVVMTPAEKLRLAQELDAAGFRELEVGMPAISEQEAQTIKTICNAGLKAHTVALCRAVRGDIELAAACGARGISISLPIGKLQLEHKLHMTLEQVIDKVVELSNFASGLGLTVTLSPVDNVRASEQVLVKYLTEVTRHGHADRVRLVDTVGSATPEAIAYLVRLFKRTVDLPIEVHVHDDFGLATANTIAGLLAGAEVASTTLNGIGERSGNAATEEVVLALELLYGISTGVDTTRLTGLSELVQETSGFRVHPHKAIVGTNAFAQEAGLVVAGFLNDPFTAVPYLPEVVGQRSRIVLGKKSGTTSIQVKLQELGLAATDAQVASLLSSVKEKAQVRKGPVGDAEFSELASALLGAAGPQ